MLPPDLIGEWFDEVQNRKMMTAMATKRKRSHVEWIGGFVSMPFYITGEGEPYRPEALFWMNSNGAVLGSEVAKPGELFGLAAASLRSTMERPMVGRAHAPARVRVASPELADVLRAGHPSIDIVCAPTPELDAVLAEVCEALEESAETESSYLSPGIEPDAVASLFRAAAGLFRARPWRIVPNDSSLFSVTIEELGLRDAVLSVMGQMGQSLGVILFSGIDDFEAFTEAGLAMARGQEASTIPPHLALHFERGTDLMPALLEEVAEHGWEIAGPNAYPLLTVMERDAVARAPTADELTAAEAIALALPEVLAEKLAWLTAWNGGEPVSRTVSVRTHAGVLDVTLRASRDLSRGRYQPSHDVLDDLIELAWNEGDIDPEARIPLEDELGRRFATSPEAEELAEVKWCYFLMEYAATYCQTTIATLEPEDLEEVIFEIFPQKVSVEASAAYSIIKEIRAFYTFLKREFGLDQADECLRVLGGTAAADLENALADPGNWGMAKSMFMAGRDAGFDMDTQEGIDAWMRVMQSRSPAAGPPSPSFDGPTRAVKSTASRTKKKAARKARKRNK